METMLTSSKRLFTSAVRAEYLIAGLLSYNKLAVQRAMHISIIHTCEHLKYHVNVFLF